MKRDMFSKPFCWVFLNDEDILTIKTFYSYTVIIKRRDSTVDRFNQQITHHSLFDLF